MKFSNDDQLEASWRHMAEFEFDARGFLVLRSYADELELAELRSRFDSLRLDNEAWTDQQQRASNIHDSLFRDVADKLHVHPLTKLFMGYPHRLIESYAVSRTSGLLDLHGGASEPLAGSRYLDLSAGSTVRGSQLYTLRIKVLIYLDDCVETTDGQFLYVEGSHKSNYSFHHAFPAGRQAADHLTSTVSMRAGDALWLNEALLHGATFKATHFPRRFIAFQFGAAFMADWGSFRGGMLDAAGYSDASAEVVD